MRTGVGGLGVDGSAPRLRQPFCRLFSSNALFSGDPAAALGTQVPLLWKAGSDGAQGAALARGPCSPLSPPAPEHPAAPLAAEPRKCCSGADGFGFYPTVYAAALTGLHEPQLPGARVVWDPCLMPLAFAVGQRAERIPKESQPAGYRPLPARRRQRRRRVTARARKLGVLRSRPRDSSLRQTVSRLPVVTTSSRDPGRVTPAGRVAA
ncbi:unnamed protein product [Rangifer tarandus platyrhynchus]|uniref:Uncharacterized protein n=1 Tax=Rangifer tarandus platyrhynchus TaxID=3082113 RepID=A0AC59ZMI8_RANTA